MQYTCPCRDDQIRITKPQTPNHMNKTIIININGIVFHIEEDAYEILRSYMTEVKRHFAYSSDNEEIVQDIENRLAEMFTERLTEQSKQVIVQQDVVDITARMGNVNDFDVEFDDEHFGGMRTAHRSLFRDPEDRMIGGVCSGLGHYFDIEAKWVRLIAVLATILWGTGLIVYLILWMVTPRAKTRADRMAMKGEPINLQNFKRNLDEEIDALQQNLNQAGSQLKPGLNATEDFLREAGDRTGTFLTRVLGIMFKIVGAFVIFVCCSLLFSCLLGLLFIMGFFDGHELDTFPFNIINPEYQSAIYFSAAILIIIPLIALILFALRVLFNRKITGKTTSFALLIIWITGLGMAVFYGAKLGSEFKSEARYEQQSLVKPFPTYHIKLNKQRFFSKDDSLNYNVTFNGRQGKVKIANDIGEIQLYVERSDDSTAFIIKDFSARGRDFESALRNAQKSGYEFIQADSIITLDKYLHFPPKQAYRDQEVKVTLKVPLNTRLIFDGEMNSIIRDINLRDCLPEDSEWETPSTWIMTTTGLKCADESMARKPSED